MLLNILLILAALTLLELTLAIVVGRFLSLSSAAGPVPRRAAKSRREVDSSLGSVGPSQAQEKDTASLHDPLAALP